MLRIPARNILTCTVLMLAVSIPAVSAAGFWTGQTLINKLVRCDNFSGVSATECSEGMGYIKGVADSMDIRGQFTELVFGQA